MQKKKTLKEKIHKKYKYECYCLTSKWINMLLKSITFSFDHLAIWTSFIEMYVCMSIKIMF